MTKVLHVIVDTDVGGAELMLRRLILHPKSSASVSHSVVSLTSVGVIGNELLNNGVDVVGLGANSWCTKMKLIFLLVKEISQRKPDVVHTWMYHSDLLGGVAAKICRIQKIVWCVRSSDITKGTSKLTVLIRRMCASLSKSIPDTIIFAANVSKDVHTSIGYDKDKSIVISNGFMCPLDKENLFDRDSARNQIGISKDEICIVSVARFNRVKDQYTFIRMASILLKSHGNLIFLMVGRGNTEKNKELVDALERHGVKEKFLLVGEVNNPSYYLKASDVFCLHSVTEGFPNSLGEAMLNGLPCVTTDVGDAAYMLDNPNYVVPHSNDNALASAVGNLAKMSIAERSSIGVMNRQRILENFSMITAVEKYLHVYKS